MDAALRGYALKLNQSINSKLSMKIKLALAVLLATVAGTVLAGPLAKQHVGQDAKWLVHIDFDQLRTSKLGQFVIKDVLIKKVDEVKVEAKTSFLTNMDVMKIISQLHSLTAYGTTFETFDGVLLLQVEPETRKILEGAAAGLLLKEDGTLTKTNEDGSILYSLQDQYFASPQENGVILFGPSKAAIKRVAAVMAGKSKNLTRSKTFSDFPAVSDNFILLAVAEGFQDHLPIPPQAQVLRQADGARVVLGEKAGNLFVGLALKAKDSEVLKQIQQVVEGIVALGSLSQSENKELQEFIQSIKVTATDKMLSVTAAYSVDSLITQAKTMLSEEKKPHKKPEADKAEKPEADKAEKPESSAGDSQ
jgi:hypothetical protein